MRVPNLEAVEQDIERIQDILKIEAAIDALKKFSFPKLENEIAYLKEAQTILFEKLHGREHQPE